MSKVEVANSEMDSFKDLEGFEALQKILDENDKVASDVIQEANDKMTSMLELHKVWLDSNGKDGKRLKLTGNLRDEFFNKLLKDKNEDRSAVFFNNRINRASISFKGADLRKADLKLCNFDRVDLYRANLEGADLRGANLKGSELDGCNLTDAKVDGCFIDSKTKIQKDKLVLAKGYKDIVIEDLAFKKEFDKEMKIYLLLSKRIPKEK